MPPLLVFEFSDTIWFWKGPAPHYFVTVPEHEAAQIKAIEKLLDPTAYTGLCATMARDAAARAREAVARATATA